MGLGIYQPNGAFLEALAELARLRERRNQKIIQRMQEWSIQVTYEDILSLSNGQSIGRPHFASLLVKRGLVKNQEQFGVAVTLVSYSGGVRFEPRWVD